jgi:hypothetical protein
MGEFCEFISYIGATFSWQFLNLNVGFWPTLYDVFLVVYGSYSAKLYNTKQFFKNIYTLVSTKIQSRVNRYIKKEK